MKLHFVRYLETRRDLVIHASPTLVMSCSFDQGLNLRRGNGHQTKADAVRRIDAVNHAAGKPVAEYAGRLVPETN